MFYVISFEIGVHLKTLLIVIIIIAFTWKKNTEKMCAFQRMKWQNSHGICENFTNDATQIRRIEKKEENFEWIKYSHHTIIMRAFAFNDWRELNIRWKWDIKKYSFVECIKSTGSLCNLFLFSFPTGFIFRFERRISFGLIPLIIQPPACWTENGKTDNYSIEMREREREDRTLLEFGIQNKW